MIETKVIERNEDDSDFTYADNEMEPNYEPFEYVFIFTKKGAPFFNLNEI